VNHSLRRRLRWTAIGFFIAFSLPAAIVIADGLSTAHFEALNQSSRPVTLRDWLEFALPRLDLYMLAGVVGALIGYIASFARPIKSKKRAVGRLLIACGLVMATLSFGSPDFLDSGEETPPVLLREMAPVYLLEFLLIVGGASLVWMGNRPRAT
jgi:uncharacterized integral membrane protein